uniref:IrrE N-terminal-like domain-containing protein n=1 Tax=Thermocrinis ruber TaxID=75906 RepID=A0A7C5SXA5_9AQUI
MKVDIINPSILRELVQKFPEGAQRARKKFKNFDRWLLGEDCPTYNQLVQLSKIFDVPFGNFFLEKLPQKSLPFEGGSKNFQDAVMHAKRVQNWAREILLEFGHEGLEYAGKCRGGFDEDVVVEELKKMFGGVESFDEMVKRAEEKGMFVLKSGYIKNVRRALDPEEFKGFVLYDSIAPVVFINNRVSVREKAFTLLHATVHVLMGESAVFDWESKEKNCFKTSAKFLEELGLKETETAKPSVINYWSERFLTLLVEAVHSGILLYTDLVDITGLSLKKLLSLLEDKPDRQV